MSLLTDEEIKLLGEGTSGTWQDDLQFARAIEAAALKKLSEQSESIEIEYPDYSYQGMGCGLEDRDITDRYEAMRYGWDCAIDAMAERIPNVLYLHPAPQSEWQPIETAPYGDILVFIPNEDGGEMLQHGTPEQREEVMKYCAMNRYDANAEQTSKKIRELTQKVAQQAAAIGIVASDPYFLELDAETQYAVEQAIASVKGGTACSVDCGNCPRTDGCTGKCMKGGAA